MRTIQSDPMPTRANKIHFKFILIGKWMKKSLNDFQLLLWPLFAEIHHFTFDSPQKVKIIKNIFLSHSMFFDGNELISQQSENPFESQGEIFDKFNDFPIIFETLNMLIGGSFTSSASGTQSNESLERITHRDQLSRNDNEWMRLDKFWWLTQKLFSLFFIQFCKLSTAAGAFSRWAWLHKMNRNIKKIPLLNRPPKVVIRRGVHVTFPRSVTTNKLSRKCNCHRNKIAT